MPFELFNTEVAFSCLYDDLDSIYPLVHNLPEDILEVSFDEDGDREADFTRPLVPEDCEIYNSYATRVRAMHIHANTGITERILGGFCSYRPTQDLLPRLHTLVINLFSENCYLSKHIQALFSPTMKHFTLSISKLPSRSHYDLASSLSSLGRLCPSLVTLTIDCPDLFISDGLDTQLSWALLRLLQDLKAVKVICLRPFPLTTGILPRLSQLEWLQKLETELWPEFVPSQHDRLHQLSNLTSLHISNATWKTFSNILGLAITSPMKEVHVNFLEENHPTFHLADFSPADDPKLIPNVLDQLAMISAIEHIVIHEVAQFLPPSDLYNKAGLRLGQLENVQTFDCVSSAASLFGNTWLEIISSWSHLCVLSVFVDRSDLYPKMTLEGLLPIVTQCMNLHTLQVSVECKEFDLQPLRNAKLAPIRTVDLPHSPIIDPEPVIIRCLTEMFPTAQSLSGNRYPTWKPWTIINRAFGGLEMDD